MKPDLRDEQIAACLHEAYGLRIARVTFLPVGADPNAGSYRADGEDGAAYFVKLRRAAVFDEVAVALVECLAEQGIAQIIRPKRTRAGELSVALGEFRMTLQPFVAGDSARGREFSASQWSELGAAVRRIHGTTVPDSLARRIRREAYSTEWREVAAVAANGALDDKATDSIGAEFVELLKAKRDQVLDLVSRAERHAESLRSEPRELVLCHSDLHGGNILVPDAGGLCIVDWDEPIFAPKERDLMFAGGAQGYVGHSPQEEETHFYRGYGDTAVDPVALAYYRCERIVADIAVSHQEILGPSQAGVDRAQSLHNLEANFLPGNTIDLAVRSP